MNDTSAFSKKCPHTLYTHPINPFYAFFLAIITGITAGFGTLLFRNSIYWLRGLIYGHNAPIVLQMNTTIPWWRICVSLILGGLVIGWIIKKLLSDKRPQGIAQVIAIYHRNEPITVRSGILGAISNALSVALGFSVGRESPALHFSASLTSWLSRIFSIHGSYFRLMLSCAISASIATSFGTPIAALIFALEITLIPISLFCLLPTITGAIIGTIITTQFDNKFPALFIPQYTSQLMSRYFAEIPLYIILGLVCGIMAIVVMQGIFRIQKMLTLLPIPAWIWPGVAGIITAVIGLFFPEVFGTGYHTINLALILPLSIKLSVLILIAKLIASICCLGMGVGGGIFTPSLFIGAFIGMLMGHVFYLFIPGLIVDYRCFILAGTAATTGTILGTPLAIIILAFELTKSYPLSLNVFIATMVAHFLRKKIQKHSYFEYLRANMLLNSH